jgi:hypothetical protein
MHLLWFVILIQFLLPPFWMLISYLWLDARWSGWKRLARLYPADHEPTGRLFEKATVSMNARSYRGIATVGMNADGIYVRLIPAFFLQHPPLMVPWRNMKTVEVGTTTEFELAAPIPVRLRLTEPVLHEAIRQMEFNSPKWGPISHRLAG